MKVSRERRLGVSLGSAIRLLDECPEDILGTDELSVELFGFEISHDVKVAVGELIVVAEPLEVAVLPFRIEAGSGAEVFPVLDAELEVMPTSECGIALTLDGAYRPPGGLLGEAVDRLALGHVARDAIDRYFDRVVDRIRRGSASLDALEGVPV